MLTRFDGLLWLVRVLLWLTVAGVCFGVWPRLPAGLANHRNMMVPELGHVVLYYDDDARLIAWDYEANKRWPIADITAAEYPHVCLVAGKALARVDGDQIRIDDIEPPHHPREFAMTPAIQALGRLILVTRDERFAVFDNDTRNKRDFHVVDLASMRVTDSIFTERMIYPNPSNDQIHEGPSLYVRERQHWWAISDEGKLVDVEVREPKHVNSRFRMTKSRDERFIAHTQHAYIKFVGQDNDTALWSAYTLAPIRNTSFSHDGTRLFTETHFGELEVWDTATGRRTAESLPRWSVSVTRRYTAALGLVVTLLALGLAFRAKSLEVAFADATLAMVGCLLLRGIDGFRNVLELNESASMLHATPVMVGIYWCLGRGQLWRRIAASAVVLFPLAMGVTLARYDLFFEDQRNTVLPITIAASTVAMPVLAIAACWIVVPLTWIGLRASPDPDKHRRWTFDLATVFALMAAVAWCLGFMRLFMVAWDANAKPDRVEKVWGYPAGAYFAFETLYMVAIIGACMAIPFAWLGLWRWTRWRTIGFAIPAVLFFYVMMWSIQSYALLPFSRTPWLGVFDRITIPLTQIGAMVVPLLLARRHGYQWRWVERTSEARTTPGSSDAGMV